MSEAAADAAPCTPHRVRGRVLFGALALSVVLAAILVAKLWPAWGDGETPEPLPDAIFSIVAYVVLFSLLRRVVRGAGGSIAGLLGPRPDAPARRWAVETGIAGAAAGLPLLVRALRTVPDPVAQVSVIEEGCA